MVTEKQLKELKIFDWRDIKATTDTIILGNGFSLNFCSNLNYQSLFNYSKSRLSEESLKLFKQFNTENFEVVLEKLQIYKDVSRVFDFSDSDIDTVINEVKSISPLLSIPTNITLGILFLTMTRLDSLFRIQSQG